MKQLHYAFYFCLTAFTAPLWGQTMTVDSSYELAVGNYPLIKQYELIEKTKEYSISNANKAYLPQVSITAIEGYIFGNLPTAGNSADASRFKFIGLGQITQTIWDGGATKTQKKIIETSSEVDKTFVDVSLHELRSRVDQLYFGILLIDEQQKQLQIQNEILENNIGRVKKMNENGLAYKTDVDEMRVEQLKLNQQKKDYSYTRSGYLTMLSYLIGKKLEQNTTLEKPVALPVFTDSIHRPELLLYKNQRNLIKAQSDMQNVNLMPKIGLLGAGIMMTPGIELGASKLSSLGVVGLNLSWNLNAFYKNSNDKQLTQQNLNKINVQEKTFLFNTQLQLEQKAADIDRQTAILEDDNEIVKLRQTIREGYQLKYNTGAGPLIDLLNATEKESEARAQKALHEIQLLMTTYQYQTIRGN